jgi:hypothetical protein
VVAQELSDLADLGDESIRPQVRKWLTSAIDQYDTERDAEGLWTSCSGKQVIGPVASMLGISGPDALERQVLQLLAEGEITIPTPLDELRQYVSELSLAIA